MTADDISYLRQYVESHAGIFIEPGREYLFETRLGVVAQRNGFDSIPKLVKQLRATSSSRLHQEMIEAISTQETSFFRDGHPFEALRKVILPELISRRAAPRRLCLWCAASSTGQEPFSLAILLRENFPQLQGWEVKIIATDLSEAAIARAREGRFNRAEVTRGMPPMLLAKYFQVEAEGYRLRDEVRRTVEFRQFNLVNPWNELPKFDLILLRNVLIYFSLASKRRVLEKARERLKPDGYLLLGAAETTLHVDAAYEVVHQEKSAFYRIAPRAAK